MTKDELKRIVSESAENEKINSLALENQSKVNHDEAMISLGKSQAYANVYRELNNLCLEEKGKETPKDKN